MARFRTTDVAVVAMLAALTGALQAYNGIIGVPSGFGMTLDLVAVPALVALFVFGFEHAVSVLVIGTLIITLISPTSWIGAGMKLAGTLPMLAVPALFAMLGGKRGWLALACAALVFSVCLAFSVSGGANLALRQYLPDSLPGAGLLLGMVPIALFSAFAFILLQAWRRFGEPAKLGSLSSPAVAAAVLAVALLARAPLTVFSNYYLAMPVFWGMPTEAAMQAFPVWLVVGWNCAQGAVEFAVAWIAAYGFGLSARYGGE